MGEKRGKGGEGAEGEEGKRVVACGVFYPMWRGRVMEGPLFIC